MVDMISCQCMRRYYKNSGGNVCVLGAVYEKVCVQEAMCEYLLQ